MRIFFKLSFFNFFFVKGTLCPPKLVTEQVKVASLPSGTVTFCKCPMNLGMPAKTATPKKRPQIKTYVRKLVFHFFQQKDLVCSNLVEQVRKDISLPQDSFSVYYYKSTLTLKKKLQVKSLKECAKPFQCKNCVRVHFNYISHSFRSRLQEMCSFHCIVDFLMAHEIAFMQLL